jgi:hypothetical protein
MEAHENGATGEQLRSASSFHFPVRGGRWAIAKRRQEKCPHRPQTSGK